MQTCIQQHYLLGFVFWNLANCSLSQSLLSFLSPIPVIHAEIIATHYLQAYHNDLKLAGHTINLLRFHELLVQHFFFKIIFLLDTRVIKSKSLILVWSPKVYSSRIMQTPNTISINVEFSILQYDRRIITGIHWKSTELYDCILSMCATSPGKYFLIVLLRSVTIQRVTDYFYAYHCYFKFSAF